MCAKVICTCKHSVHSVHACNCACVRACVRASVRPCVRASVRASVRPCVRACVNNAVEPSIRLSAERHSLYWFRRIVSSKKTDCCRMGHAAKRSVRRAARPSSASSRTSSCRSADLFERLFGACRGAGSNRRVVSERSRCDASLGTLQIDTRPSTFAVGMLRELKKHALCRSVRRAARPASLASSCSIGPLVHVARRVGIADSFGGRPTCSTFIKRIV